MQPLALGQIGRCAWELGLLLQPEVNFLRDEGLLMAAARVLWQWLTLRRI